MNIHKYDSPLGELTLTADDDALTGLYFSDTITPLHGDVKPLPIFDTADRWLDVYFSGKAPGFIPPIKTTGTEFQQSVRDILLTIPFGQVMTYSQIATSNVCSGCRWCCRT